MPINVAENRGLFVNENKVGDGKVHVRGRMASGAPNPVDVHVGSRIRLCRTRAGMTQEKLAQGLGVTFQQVQKYERGANRVGASRLLDLATVFNVPVSFFFADMPDEVARQSPRQIAGGLCEEQEPFIMPQLKPDSLKLAMAFDRIEDPKMRKHVWNLVKALSEAIVEPTPA